MSGMKNLTAFLKDGKFDLRDREIPEPKEGEVQLSVKCVGICGTDIHFWQHGSIGEMNFDTIILGHEASGQVIKLGPGVTNLSVGDRVSWDPNMDCHACSSCKVGKRHLCKNSTFSGGPGVPGGLSNIITHPADFCVKLPDAVSYEEGALLEPLTVGISGCERAGVSEGDNVLICGAGCVGLMTLLVAKHRGANNICVTDQQENRLSLAREMGATHTIIVKKEEPRVLADQVVKALGDHADVSIDCTGVEQAITTAIHATRIGGSVACVGLATKGVELPLLEVSIRQIDIKGVIRLSNIFADALDLVVSGAVNVKPIVSHRFPLQEAPTAFELVRAGSDNLIKVIIYHDPDVNKPSGN